MIKRHFPAFAIFSFLALVITLPILLRPGQIFLLDLALPPSLDMHTLLLTQFGATLPIIATMVLLGTVLSVGVVMKIFMLFVLLLPMCSMYLLLLPITKRGYATLGGVMLLMNPFMYERFIAGHWFVMLGVGLLSVLMLMLRRALASGSYRDTALLALTFALYPIFSLHFAYISAALALCYLIVHTVKTKARGITFTSVFRHGALLLSIMFVIDGFMLFGVFQSGSTLLAIDKRDFATFVTSSDPSVGVYANVLSLYGFWREGALLPKDILPVWWLPSLIILLFAIVGFIVRLRVRDTLAQALLIALFPLVVLAVGYATPLSKWVTELAIRFVPGFTGLRETAKLVGVLAFLYAYLAPLGLESAVSRMYGGARKSGVLAVVLLFVCVVGTSFTFLWGALGQVHLGTYPESWATVDRVLMEDKSRGKVLIFPWRGYLELDFAEGAFVANPTPGYFSFPVVTSVSINNVLYDQKYTTEFDRFIPIDKDDTAIKQDIATIKTLGVTHVVLLKTSDWRRYSPLLDEQGSFALLYDDKEIALYRLK